MRWIPVEVPASAGFVGKWRGSFKMKTPNARWKLWWHFPEVFCTKFDNSVLQEIGLWRGRCLAKLNVLIVLSHSGFGHGGLSLGLCRLWLQVDGLSRSQWIVPGLGNQLIRIFAISFSELQNIDKLLLSLSEAWNKGIRDYKNKPKQMANKKNRLEKKQKKTCNQLIKSQLLTQRAQSSKPSGRVQSAGDTVISEAQKQGILRSMKLPTRTVNRINIYIYICYKY